MKPGGSMPHLQGFSNNNNVHNINFHALHLNCQNILGRETCKTLNLIKKVNKVMFQSDNHSVSGTTLFDRRDRAVRWWTPTLTDLKRM